MMKLKPIIFNDWSVKRILDGAKTQTRRIFKPQPTRYEGSWVYKDDVFPTDEAMQDHLFHNVYGGGKSPYGAVYADGTSDVLYGRERFQAQNQNGQWYHEVLRDERASHNWVWTNPIEPSIDETPPRWMLGRYMPKIAARLYLKVENIQIQRLWDMSIEDVYAEGVISLGDVDEDWAEWKSVWDDINAGGGFAYDTNPWVWAITFSRDNA